MTAPGMKDVTGVGNVKENRSMRRTRLFAVYCAGNAVYCARNAVH